MVDELGGLDALAPTPGRPEAEPFSQLDFAQRHVLKLTLLDRWGALPAAGDRHVAEFLPSVLTEESGWGADCNIELTPIATPRGAPGRATSPRSTPAGRQARTSQTWDSGELPAPVIDSLVTGDPPRAARSTSPTPGQCPDLPADAVVESICVVDGDGIRGRDAAHAARRRSPSCSAATWPCRR